MCGLSVAMGRLRGKWGAKVMLMGLTDLFPVGFARGKAAEIGKAILCFDNQYMMSKHLLNRAHHNGKKTCVFFPQEPLIVSPVTVGGPLLLLHAV